MYRVPSRRKRKIKTEKPNLIPIMDATFIFIFFLLMSVNFIKIFEIQSDVPLVSNREPPPDKKQLALTLKITADSINIYTGIPSSFYKKITNINTGDYDLEKLHTTLVDLKSGNQKEKTVILDPEVDLEYEKIVQIMDAIRILRPTDEAFFNTGKDGVAQKIQELFSNIIFGDIQS
ncbi:MAG: hypothetical protein A2381_00280 [Bdellovibrionales bacterium RIFOXYB1_FULL_37_110]|nr:MAG: hypothetical protein A2417_11335 [Bdellovibrionales bacterium RIFOXYC1_FULL_37_79]OFZ60830.1 MAG: hypothetical protein A2381_00280 [Bdellovibrionales bacterium RIFOXYB1_FULL_37_110]OFZ62360.1 MAG: hypothetical protein A2577_02945 [Bdellovibrionales bacterium RIFOXYD1_FULL_36_51]OFZ66771.1 MAG: hypothetical protein A2328_06195 [Bdellovibrionales bacterium RIFOXYB2_FULL_36_6]